MNKQNYSAPNKVDIVEIDNNYVVPPNRKHYLPIHLDDYEVIVEKTLRYCKEQTPILDEGFHRGWWPISATYDAMYQYVPELEFCLDKYGVKPRYFGLYLVEKAPENSKRTTALKPHIDYGPLGSRINVPILNCQNTITEFYENVDIRYNQDPITGTRSYVTTNDDYRLIDSFTLSEPTLMNIKIGHKVVVPEGLPLPRIVLSIGPNKDISYMLDA